MSKQKEKVVFSTQTGDLRKQGAVRPLPQRSLPPGQQDLRIMRDAKGRKGKMVTVVNGFVLRESELEALAKNLKTLCGAGGTVKTENGIQAIEIQGDHRDKIAEKLKALGYKVKFAGG